MHAVTPPGDIVRMVQALCYLAGASPACCQYSVECGAVPAVLALAAEGIPILSAALDKHVGEFFVAQSVLIVFTSLLKEPHCGRTVAEKDERFLPARPVPTSCPTST